MVRCIPLTVAVISTAVLMLGAAGSASAQTAAGPANAPAGTIDARPWPRQYSIDGVDFAFYRPELDSWTGDRLQARLAMAVTTGQIKTKDGKTAPRQQYGVLWITARTETDKDAREVTLDDITVDRASFPSDKAKEAQYLALARKAVPAAALVASLDQLESQLAISQADKVARSVPVNNAPPEILFDFQPGVLVLIDGEPVWRSAGVAGVERVINTRSLLLRFQSQYYLGYAGHWASAPQLAGPWTAAPQVAPALEKVMRVAVAARQVPSADQANGPEAAVLQAGKLPDVFVRATPTELIVFDGGPAFEPIEGGQLSYVSNTPADVFVYGDAGVWYVLVSGRWFTAPSSKGPWTYVAAGDLPTDFKAIPGDSPKAAVLASIPDTPEAKESLVANTIPQTATVDRTKASFTARYDGDPQFKPIEGSALAYAWNSPTPIIRVLGAYYALDNGVWFTAATPAGPWQVATSVPPAIYAIPAASPLHYVTYAYVYGSNGDEVYVGYTPGYFGTVVSGGTVVYGAGYPCSAWVGDEWYGCPTTYGYGAAFAYGAGVGWGLAFGWGWAYPWYNPWWGPWAGYWPGDSPWAAAGYAYGNVYGRWGQSVVAGTAAAWANPWTGNYGRGFQGGYDNTATGGRGYGYAGRNTNVYTGASTGTAGEVRYNPQTGRVVAGRGATVSNIYTGNGMAAAGRTVVNTNTGRVTNQAGVATRTGAGATAAGGFSSEGAGGNAAGAGYLHYDRATGDISHGGAAKVNGDIYAGHDGQVYKRDINGGWEKAGGNGQFSKATLGDRSLQTESAARARGFQRDAAAGRDDGMGARRPSFDRSAYGGGFHGGMGGARTGRRH